MKKLTPPQLRTYLSDMSVEEIISFDELTTDENQNTSRSKVRNTMNTLIDKSASKRNRILLVMGR